MHKNILSLFKKFRSFMQFIKIVIAFVIMILLLYWIQNLTGATWAWLGFITPLFEGLLNFANSICSLNFEFFGAVFELKYMTAVIILILCGVLVNVISVMSERVEEIYIKAHHLSNKVTENLFNKALEIETTVAEKKLNKYSVTLKAQLKKKFAIQELNADIENQNKQINDFIINSLGVRPFDVVVTNNDMYYFSEYKFNDFNNIDKTLDILFKIFKSNTQLDYAICIQIEDKPEQMAKLLSLNNFGKITMAADTNFRYYYNKEQAYKTSIVGEFRDGDKNIEVHEFQEKFGV